MPGGGVRRRVFEVGVFEEGAFVREAAKATRAKKVREALQEVVAELVHHDEDDQAGPGRPGRPLGPGPGAGSAQEHQEETRQQGTTAHRPCPFSRPAGCPSKARER